MAPADRFVHRVVFLFYDNRLHDAFAMTDATFLIAALPVEGISPRYHQQRSNE